MKEFYDTENNQNKKISSESKITWHFLSFSNLSLTAMSTYFAYKLNQDRVEYEKFLSLLSHYDDGLVIFLIIASFIAVALVYFYGFVANNTIFINIADQNAKIFSRSFVTLIKFYIIFCFFFTSLTYFVTIRKNDLAGVRKQF